MDVCRIVMFFDYDRSSLCVYNHTHVYILNYISPTSFLFLSEKGDKGGGEGEEVMGEKYLVK